MTKQASFEVQSNAAHGAGKRLNSSLPAATLEGSSNSFLNVTYNPTKLALDNKLFTLISL